MKKLTAILLCLLLTAALAIPAMAAGNTVMTISTETATVKPGDEVEFKITMSGSEKCTSFGLLLEFDSKVFEVVEGECTLEGTLFSTFDKDKGLACMLKEAAAIDDEVGTFTLRVKADAPSGKVEVNGTSSVKNGSATVRSEVEKVELTVSGGNGAQSSASSGNQSNGSQSSSSSGTQEQPAIGEAEAVIATQAAEETAAAEQTPDAPEAVVDEIPAGEEQKQESDEPLLIMPAPTVGADESNKDMIVIIVAGAVVLLAAVVLIVVLKKSRR